MMHTLPTIKAALLAGDTLTLGELPSVMNQCSSGAIYAFAEEIQPILEKMPDVDPNTVNAMIGAAYAAAKERERMMRTLGSSQFIIRNPRAALNRKDPRIARPREPRHTLAKVRDNDPERCAAKGLKPFDIDGVTVWAGSLKAAVKAAKKMKLQGG